MLCRLVCHADRAFVSSTLLTIDAQDIHRIFRVPLGITATLIGMTVTNGNTYAVGPSERLRTLVAS